MTTMLVLGGTAWLGGNIARAAAAAGYDVTCLARGESGAAPDGVHWVKADRSEPHAYDAVRQRDWDAVVDVSWQPGMVRAALAAVGERARHWAYVSSGSVYADHSTPGADESGELLPALEGDVATREQYGEAKVACENACREAVGDRLLVARSGLIGGHGDRSDRFGYWVGRFAAAADQDDAWARSPVVLVPDADDLPTQTVDVRDLAEWIVRAGTSSTTGTFDAVGPPRRLGEVLETSAAVAGFAGLREQDGVARVPSGWLRAQDVGEYMGPRSLPLWLVDPDWQGFSARDGSAAREAGLTYRPLEDLVRESLRWERRLGLGRERAAGLSPDDERALVEAWQNGR